MSVQSNFWIQESRNYLPGKGNIFLNTKVWSSTERRYIEESVGVCDYDSSCKKWRVTVAHAYNFETDSDCLLIGLYDCRDQAKQALYDNRDKALVYEY